MRGQKTFGAALHCLSPKRTLEQRDKPIYGAACEINCGFGLVFLPTATGDAGGGDGGLPWRGGLTGRGRVLKNPAKRQPDGIVMKVRNSLKSLRGRHRDNKIVRRKGRVYVINKTQPRFKARQG